MPLYEVVLRVISALAALVVVLLLAWLLLRWLNKRMPGMSGGSARMITVLDRVAVGKSGVVLLLRVQDKVFLVAVNEHAIEKLHEFEDPEGIMKLPDVVANPSFAEALKDAAGKVGFGKKKDENKDGGDDS